jgi:malate synthase
MFDGEDALGQVQTMSLDNQRSLKLAIDRDPMFLKVAEEVAGEMNQWAKGFFGRETISDWKKQLDFTTKIFRARGLHLDDRTCGARRSAASRRRSSTWRCTVANNHKALRASGASIVLYLPKIQTAEEAALWRRHAQRARAAPRPARRHIKVYVLVEQFEARLPVDGDPRRPRTALHRLQHRPLGLHQQRRRRAGLGSVVHQPEHRRDHDDLRLHADTTRTACAGR